MVGGNLKVETIALFRKYGEIHRDVFLEEIVGVSGGLGFIGGHGSTREELDAILRSCIERGKALRAPTGRKRGRPRGSNGRIRQAMSRSHLSESSSVAQGCVNSQGWDEDEFARDWAEHGWFRTVCMVLGDIPANRPSLLEQILLFIQRSNRSELSAIRSCVKKRRLKIKRATAGRPEAQADEQIMVKARVAAWMRYVERKTQKQVATSVGIRRRSCDEKFTSIRWLESYLAAAISRAIPASYILVSATGRQIKPGALDHKPLQTYIEHHTGLPFRAYPEECKCIVTALWPQGDLADWRRIKRQLSYRQKKRKKLSPQAAQ